MQQQLNLILNGKGDIRKSFFAVNFNRDMNPQLFATAIAESLTIHKVISGNR